MIFAKSWKSTSGRNNSHKRQAVAALDRFSAALGENETYNLFHAFFNVVPELVVICGGDGYFRLLNKYCTEWLGYTQDELVEKPFISFVHPDDIDSTQDAFKNILKGKHVIEFVNRYKKKDGEFIKLQWSAGLCDKTGFVTAIARVLK